MSRYIVEPVKMFRVRDTKAPEDHEPVVFLAESKDAAIDIAAKYEAAPPVPPARKK